MKRELKINYYGFFGFFGFYGFQEPIFFLFFLFFLFFFIPKKITEKGGSGLIQKQAQEKAGHLQKIKDFMQGKDKITNDEVQKLLGVSDATAERYLDELEKEGVLAQKGEKKGIYYQKIG